MENGLADATQHFLSLFLQMGSSWRRGRLPFGFHLKLSFGPSWNDNNMPPRSFRYVGCGTVSGRIEGIAVAQCELVPPRPHSGIQDGVAVRNGQESSRRALAALRREQPLRVRPSAAGETTVRDPSAKKIVMRRPGGDRKIRHAPRAQRGDWKPPLWNGSFPVAGRAADHTHPCRAWMAHGRRDHPFARVFAGFVGTALF